MIRLGLVLIMHEASRSGDSLLLGFCHGPGVGNLLEREVLGGRVARVLVMLAIRRLHVLEDLPSNLGERQVGGHVLTVDLQWLFLVEKGRPHQVLV